MNKKYYVSIKYDNFIDNKINDFLIFNYKDINYVKEILSLNNKYRMNIKK